MLASLEEVGKEKSWDWALAESNLFKIVPVFLYEELLLLKLLELTPCKLLIFSLFILLI